MTRKHEQASGSDLRTAIDAKYELRLAHEKRERAFLDSLSYADPTLSAEEREVLLKRFREEHATIDAMSKAGVFIDMDKLGDLIMKQDTPEHRAELDAHFERLQAGVTRERDTQDAEERARKRMEWRRDKLAAFKTRMRWVCRTVALACLLAVVGAGVWAYYNVKTIVPAWDKYADDSRTCLVKVGDRVVTGTRNYAYRYYNVLGWNFNYAPDTRVKTHIEPNGNAMTIVAHFADNTIQTISIGNSDSVKKEIPIAESYTFFMDGGKSTGAATYDKLCR